MLEAPFPASRDALSVGPSPAFSLPAKGELSETKGLAEPPGRGSLTLACPGGGCLDPARIKDFQHLSAAPEQMHIPTWNVVPRSKIKLFQLSLQSVQVFPLVSAGLRLVPVDGSFSPRNYLVFPKNQSWHLIHPFFPTVLVQGDGFGAIKEKSRLFPLGEACSSSLSSHQTVPLRKITTTPCCCKRGCRLVLQPLNMGIPSVPAADLFNYV